jgi:hypothetical protein
MCTAEITALSVLINLSDQLTQPQYSSLCITLSVTMLRAYMILAIVVLMAPAATEELSRTVSCNSSDPSMWATSCCAAPCCWRHVACMHIIHHQVTPCQPGSLCQSNNSTLVPKQHHQALGEHCRPPGPVPDVAAPQHTRDRDNSSKWLLKDRPTHAALQFPNQTTAVGYPI